jgi:hypothetical protein
MNTNIFLDNPSFFCLPAAIREHSCSLVAEILFPERHSLNVRQFRLKIG